MTSVPLLDEKGASPTFSPKLPIPKVQFASTLDIEQLLLPFFEVINICLKLVFIISVADEIFGVRYSCVAGVNQLVHFRRSRGYNSRDSLVNSDCLSHKGKNSLLFNSRHVLVLSSRRVLA